MKFPKFKWFILKYKRMIFFEKINSRVFDIFKRYVFEKQIILTICRHTYLVKKNFRYKYFSTQNFAIFQISTSKLIRKNY